MASILRKANKLPFILRGLSNVPNTFSGSNTASNISICGAISISQSQKRTNTHFPGDGSLTGLTSEQKQKVEKAAQEGFGKNAAAYDQNRPSYTPEILKAVLEELENPQTVSPETLKYEVLELGAGTGKLTDLIVPKLSTGWRYLATEPSEDFLNFLKTKGHSIDFSNLAASSIPLPDNSVKNILCAQCLHWFSEEESLREIQRVLIPGGKLIAVWNVNKYDDNEWTGEIYKQRFEVIKQVDGNLKNWVNSMEWKKAIEATGLFSEHRNATLPGIGYTSDLDTILSMLRTISFYNMLPDNERKTYLDKLRQAILSYQGVDPQSMDVPYNSLMYVFTPKKDL